MKEDSLVKEMFSLEMLKQESIGDVAGEYSTTVGSCFFQAAALGYGGYRLPVVATVFGNRAWHRF